jgi:molybdopterin-guanine dinucleotide biosynthesis protein
MKPIILCGNHHTGKTTLLEKGVRALVARGYRVGVVKHTSSGLVQGGEGKDTERYMRAGAETAVVLSGDRITRFVWSASRSPGAGLSAPEGTARTREEGGSRLSADAAGKLDPILAAMETDYVLIEGFKGYAGPVTRIVFGKSRDEIEELVDEVTVGYSGIGLGELGIEGPRFLPQDIAPSVLADFIEENAFDLFRFRDCGRCGFHTCRELLAAVLNGKAGLDDCSSAREP